jgi:hypothetical protein
VTLSAIACERYIVITSSSCRPAVAKWRITRRQAQKVLHHIIISKWIQWNAQSETKKSRFSSQVSRNLKVNKTFIEEATRLEFAPRPKKISLPASEVWMAWLDFFLSCYKCYARRSMTFIWTQGPFISSSISFVISEMADEQ